MTSYVLHVQEEDGFRFFGEFRTGRSFEVGDLLNLPTPPNGAGGSPPRETKGHIYRVVGVEEGSRLFVAYVTPWTEGLPECADTFRRREDGEL